MRVVSGTARGHSLKAVPGMSTRPTSDKVKEAIFSRIGPYFSGGTVLDLFAGTGSLGIEALSRGMDQAIFIDIDKKAIDVVRQNLERTKLLGQAKLFRNDAKHAIKQLAKQGMSFDLVLMDPPYYLKIDTLLVELETAGLLNPQATIVVEHDAKYTYMEQIGNMIQVKRTDYKDTAVTYYEFDPNYRGGLNE